MPDGAEKNRDLCGAGHVRDGNGDSEGGVASVGRGALESGELGPACAAVGPDPQRHPIVGVDEVDASVVERDSGRREAGEIGLALNSVVVVTDHQPIRTLIRDHADVSAVDVAVIGQLGPRSSPIGVCRRCSSTRPR